MNRCQVKKAEGTKATQCRLPANHRCEHLYEFGAENGISLNEALSFREEQVRSFQAGYEKAWEDMRSLAEGRTPR